MNISIGMMLGASSVPPPRSPEQIFGSSLLSLYRCDEGSGTVLRGRDSSGLNPTLNGSFGLEGGLLPGWHSAGLDFGVNGDFGALVQLPPGLAPSVKSAIIVATTPYPNGGVNTLGCYLGVDSNDNFLGQSVDGKPLVWGTYSNSAMEPSERQSGFMCMTWNFNDASPSFYYGANEALGYLTRVQASWPVSDVFWLGYKPVGNGRFFGKIGYVILLDRIATSTEVSEVNRYLTGVMNARGVFLGNTIPANRTRLICECDSLTHGFGAFSPIPGGYPNQLSALLSNPIEITNLGIGGQRADTAHAAAPLRVDVLWPTFTGVKAYIFWGGVNDLNQSVPPETILDTILARVAAARAAGATHVYVGTPTPIVSSNPGYETDRQDLAASLRSVAVANNYKVMDFGASGNGIGSEDDNFGSNYADDHIHPNNLGYAIAAEVARVQLATDGIT